MKHRAIKRAINLVRGIRRVLRRLEERLQVVELNARPPLRVRPRTVEILVDLGLVEDFPVVSGIPFVERLTLTEKGRNWSPS